MVHQIRRSFFLHVYLFALCLFLPQIQATAGACGHVPAGHFVAGTDKEGCPDPKPPPPSGKDGPIFLPGGSGGSDAPTTNNATYIPTQFNNARFSCTEGEKVTLSFPYTVNKELVQKLKDEGIGYVGTLSIGDPTGGTLGGTISLSTVKGDFGSGPCTVSAPGPSKTPRIPLSVGNVIHKPTDRDITALHCQIDPAAGSYWVNVQGANCGRSESISITLRWAVVTRNTWMKTGNNMPPLIKGSP